MATLEHSNDRRARVEMFPRVITVSREFGAGGARVSLRIAAELGYQLWDQELTTHLARKAKVDVALMREVDERARPLLDEVLAQSMRSRLSCSKYRTLLTRTVQDLAERGGAVIVGRGSNFLVDPENALRVRVICPLAQRVDRYAQAAGCDRASAERFVVERDRERELFVRKLCGEQVTDPVHYDVIVNTRDLTEQAAARLIIAAYRARFGSASMRPPRDESAHASLAQ